MRSTFDILSDLAPKWQLMSEAEKVSLGTTLAGVNQYKVFAATLNNFSTAIEATNESLNSNGATMRQNEVYMESLEAKVQALKTEFEKLVLGDGGLQKFAKSIVDLGTKILKFANSDIGKMIISFVALETSLGLITKNFVLLKNIIRDLGLVRLVNDVISLKNGMTTVVSSQLALKIATEGLTKALISQALAWAKTPMGMATIAITGVVALVTVIEKLNVTLDEQVEKLKQAKEEYEGVQSEIESLEERLNNVRDRMAEINSQGSLSLTDDRELQILKEEEAVLANQLTILQEQARVKQEQYTNEAKKTLGKRFEDAGAFGTTDMDMGVVVTNEGTAVQALDAYNKKIQESQEEINKLLERKQALINNGYSPESDAVGVVNGLIADEIATRDSARSSAVEYAQIIQEATQYANQEDETVKQAKETLDEYHETIGEVKDSKEELAESDEDFINNLIETNELTEEQAEKLREQIQSWIEEGNAIDDFDFDGFIDGLKNVSSETENAIDATKQFADAQKELDSAMSNLTSMASNYDVLTKAMNEYNNGGAITLDTLSKLTALGSDWVGLLEVENGQMSISEQGLKNLANAYINDAEAKAYDKAIAELNKIAEDNLNASKRDGINVSNSSANASANASQRAGHAAEIAGNQAEIAGNKWMVAWAKVANQAVSSNKVTKKQANQVTQNLKTTVDALEKARKSFKTNTVAAVKNTGAVSSNSKASGGSSKARKDNTKATNSNTKSNNSNTKSVDANTEALKANVDALKKQKEELESDINDYEKVISYLNDKVDEEIDKLEEARDKEIQVIEDRIDYYEDLADKEEEVLKGRIDNLKDARDAEKDYWDDKIQALKDANEVIEDQIELEKLLQNLENAKRKKVRVYKEGQGFVYDTDQDEVNKAQKELDEYYRKKALEDQIKSLEKQREDALAIYDKQIEDLENLRKQQKEKYDDIVQNLKTQIENIKAKYNDEIKYFKDWKAEFKKQTEAYEEEVLRQLTIQKTGIDTESQNWTTRLNNLDTFVKQYNEKLKELGDLEKQLKSAEDAYNAASQAASNYTSPSTPTSSSSDDSGYGGGGGGTSYTPTPTPKPMPTANYKIGVYEKKFKNNTSAQKYIESKPYANRSKYVVAKSGSSYYVVKKATIQAFNGITEATASSKAGSLASSQKANAIYWKYASGIASVGSNQMALVGDDPRNRELVIGSKLNGTAMSLQKGSGVVNAESTKTLAGLMNCLGKFSSSNFGAGNGILNTNTSNSNDMYIDKVVIEGSNITDVVSFKNSLMNLKSEATQRAYKHS